MSDPRPLRSFDPPAALAPESGWSEPSEPLLPRGLGRPFVSGEPEGDRVRIRYFQRDSDRALVARAWFGPGTEGPPGHVHGGSMAAVLDEAMGLGCWIVGRKVLAGRLDVRFRAVLPLGSLVTVEAWVEHVDGRHVTTRGRIVGADGTVHAKGEGLFVELTDAQIDAMRERWAAGL
ncbi:MAG: PaaI family thioesterase [Deltaproteobacteria bacterium]|nr:PaaI family thioesterase [Deltaproteobacteria bacterium]